MRHRVVIADDDPLTRDAYKAFLAGADEFECVGEARTGREAVEEFRRLQPDLVLMDLRMPEMNGVQATARICREFPRACIVVLTTFDAYEYVVAALRAGASGYLTKDASRAQLYTALRQALHGDMPLSAGVRHELVRSLVHENAPRSDDVVLDVTDRERELLPLLAEGLSNHEIAQRMYVSEGSVKQYLAHLGTKFGVSSRTQIIVKAIQLRLVDPFTLPLLGDANGP